MMSDVQNEPFNESKIGLEFYYNLYNGGKDYAEDKKLLKNIHKKKLLIEKNENKLENKVRLSWNNYRMTIDKLEKQESYARAKKDLLDVTIQEFELGLKGLTSLLDERQEYISAQAELTSALYEHLLSKYQLLGAIGNLAVVIENQSSNMEDIFSKTLEVKEEVSIEELLKETKRKDVKEDEISIEKKQVEPLQEIELEKKDFNLIEPKKIEMKLDSNGSEEIEVPIPEPIKNTTTIVKSFKDRFLSAPTNYYTINLAYAKKDSVAQNIINKNALQENAFYFRFGNELQHIKVMLGVYQTKQEAYEILKNLVDNLKKLQPRVESIELKQKLYHKYNTQENFQEEKQEVINNIEVVKKSKSLNFKEEFLRAPENYYTINLAYAQKDSTAKYIIENYNLNNKAFYFRFGEQLQHIKIMLGAYKTKEEALQFLDNLDSDLKSFEPRIEKIELKQKLYHKYHQEDKIGSL